MLLQYALRADLGNQQMSTRADAPEVVGSPISLASIIAAAKSAKELIVLAAFFGGGVVWIANYFATREQLEVLECVTKVNVRMLQASTTANEAEQGLRQTRTELREQSRFLTAARQKDSGYKEDVVRSTEARVEELTTLVAAFDQTAKSEKKASQRALTTLTQNQCLIKEQRARLVAQIGAGEL